MKFLESNQAAAAQSLIDRKPAYKKNVSSQTRDQSYKTLQTHN